MSERLNGAELFNLFMHPEATAGEVARMDLEALARKVAYRREKKVTQDANNADLSDDEIAQTILDYAHSVPPNTKVIPPREERSLVVARNECLALLFLILVGAFVSIRGWVAYDRGEIWDLALPFVPLGLVGLAVLILIGLAVTVRSFVRFRRLRSRRTR